MWVNLSVFKDEGDLRIIWSAPDTRKKLLEGLADQGFGKVKNNLLKFRA